MINNIRYSIFVRYFTQNKFNINNFVFSKSFGNFYSNYICTNRDNICIEALIYYRCPYLLSVLHRQYNKIINLVCTVYIIVLSWSTVGKVRVEHFKKYEITALKHVITHILKHICYWSTGIENRRLI